jgi:hypothetical protein
MDRRDFIAAAVCNGQRSRRRAIFIAASEFDPEYEQEK